MGLPILPFHRILCPTDFSQASTEALKVAKELALHFSSELILLHVIHPLAVIPHVKPGQFNIPLYQEKMQEYASTQLQELAKENTTQQDTTVQQKVVVGDAADAIVNTATDQAVDLVVLSTHGQTGWKNLVLGSVAEKVVRLSPRPVLVIHQRLGERKDRTDEKERRDQ